MIELSQELFRGPACGACLSQSWTFIDGTGNCMRRWLARLSFSFFILAAVLAWEAYRARDGSTWRPLLFLVAAMLCVLLGLAGVRERHKT